MVNHLTNEEVADFIARKISESPKSQREIAAECGFEHPNVLSMIKSGETKIPISRIGALAKALEVDPLHLYRLVMSAYWPETWEAIEAILHGTALTANELALVRTYRKMTHHTDPDAAFFQHETEIVVTAWIPD